MTQNNNSLIRSMLNFREVEPVYCNFVEIGHNVIEMRIRFSLVGMDHQRLVTEVVMPPVIAKAMVTMLNEQVQSYENLVGPIYMPDDKKGLEGLFGAKVEKADDI